jgi:N6-adenosine-specific RNA methylase IME4
MTLPFHPLANLFPLIEGEEFEALVADIKANGLRETISVWEGLILDGRNRARACEAADVAPRYEAFAGEASDALALVLSKNLTRRHLTDSQRAYVAAKLSTIGWGGDRSKTPNGGLTIAQAAERLRVAKRTVERAKIVQDKAAAEVQQLVEKGEMPVALAAGIAALGADEQASLIEEARGAKGPIARRALTLLKQRMRSDRERKLGEAMAPTGSYGLILEDFEWDHQTWSAAGKDSRHPSNHYVTASDAHTAEEIVKRTADRFACAAKNCILLMWTTIPHLAIGIDVLRLRGFKYASHYIWRKNRIITGYWSRAKHEVLLIGVKGDVPCPAPGTQWDSVIDGDVGEHSAKPERFHEMIEAYFPTLPKIELNRRGPPRPGWKAWGNEAEPAPPHDPDTGEILSPEPAAEQSPVEEPAAVHQSTTPPPAISSVEIEDIPSFLRPGSPDDYRRRA